MSTETYSITLYDIQDKEVLIKEPSEKLKNNFDKEKLKLGININLDSIFEKELLILNITAKFDYQFDNSPIELLKASFSFIFEIKNFEKIVTIEEGTTAIPDGLALHLITLSISTTRGLIASKTRGHFINKFYLPIIDPQSLVQGLSLDNGKRT